MYFSIIRCFIKYCLAKCLSIRQCQTKLSQTKCKEHSRSIRSVALRSVWLPVNKSCFALSWKCNNFELPFIPSEIFRWIFRTRIERKNIELTFLLLRHHRPTKCLMNMALPHFALIKTFSGEQTLFANENAKFEMLYLQSNIVGGWKVCFKHCSCCVHSCLQKRLKQTFRPIKS